MKQHFIFCNTMLKRPLTSIEISIFKRYKIFREYLDIEPIYVCTGYDPIQPKYLEELKREGVIPDDFKLVNLFDFFLSDCSFYRPLQMEQVEGATYNNGIKKIDRIFDSKTKNISFVNFYDDNGKIYRMDKYDTQGYLFGSFLISSKNRYQQINFYRKDGTLAIVYQYDENDIENIVLFDKNIIPIKSFVFEEELHLYLLYYYLNSFHHTDRINLIMDREGFLEDKITDGSIAANIKCFVLLHSSHNAIEVGSLDIKTPPYVKRLKENDGIIVLTPQQAEDVRNDFGDYGNVYYIPHPVKHQNPSSHSDRIKNRVIAVSRLSVEKQHNKMIRIFAKVVQKIPDAQLDIFGNGELKMELEQLIKELNLQNNIHLRGYTSNVEKEYRTAQCSLLTSALEGQPLVILESLSFGCPVISSNIKYGPVDMIDDGKNGFLLPENDEDMFAERIIDVLLNQKLAEKLSENAYKSIERFSDKSIAKLWKSWVEKVMI